MIDDFSRRMLTEINNKIGKDKVSGYGISNIDSGSTTYYGFEAENGNWYIMKKDSSSNFTYTKGLSNYSGNWTNRTTLIYQSYSLTFGDS